jgi:predicted nucleic acid-binding Zn ribbon protein
MRNITISLEDRVARWVRVWAAKHDTSVSKLLSHMLEEKMEVEEEYSAAMKQFLGRTPVLLKKSGRYPTRDSLHER